MKNLLLILALAVSSLVSAQIAFQNNQLESFQYQIEVFSQTEGKTVDSFNEKTHLSIQLRLPFPKTERKVLTFFNEGKETDVYVVTYNEENELTLTHEGINFVEAEIQ